MHELPLTGASSGCWRVGIKGDIAAVGVAWPAWHHTHLAAHDALLVCRPAELGGDKGTWRVRQALADRHLLHLLPQNALHELRQRLQRLGCFFCLSAPQNRKVDDCFVVQVRCCNLPLDLCSADLVP